MNTSGTETKRVDATINSDSTFTADVELLTGLNILVLLPKHKNSEGKEVCHKKYYVKVQDTRTKALQLTYDAVWRSQVVITRQIKTTYSEPDTSVENKTTQISANLKIDFNSSKLWYIKKSLENARSCAEYDNCWIFSGNNVGAVALSEEYTKQTKNCDGELPLMTTIKSEGKGSSDKYSVYITASLLPLAEGDYSPDRKYHLCINCSPEIFMDSNPNSPVAEEQYYDCIKKEWITSVGTINPI